MNGEDSQSDRDGTVEVDDNVIRLTDWLGPREELIPFGPGADAEEAERVPTAADFWSESSGAVQDALTAPHSDRDHALSPRPKQRQGRASAAAMWSHRRAALRSRHADRGRPRLDRRLTRITSTGLAAVAALVLVVIWVSVGSPGSGTGRRLATVTGGGASAGFASARNIASASQALSRQSRARSTLAPARHHVATARHRAGHRSTRPRPGAATSIASVQPVGYTTPVATSPTYSGASQSTAGSTSTQPVSTPTTSASASHGSGSASQPALGAGGSLAPGSSPDG